MTDTDVLVIIITDDEEEEEDEAGGNALRRDSSVVIVEETEQNSAKANITNSAEVLDEDLAITYTRQADILPHARFDCTLPFSFVGDCNTGPEGSNAEYCEQCFCYVCDKPAATCKLWTISGFCHCNAHKSHMYWKDLRKKAMAGFLCQLKFNFDFIDMDSDVKCAEACLLEFARELCLKYTDFVTGLANLSKPPCCQCHCHLTKDGKASERSAAGSNAGCKGCRIQHAECQGYGYTAVKDYVWAFLDQAEKENPKASVIIVLGAVKLFVTHSAPGNAYSVVLDAVQMLFGRALAMVQRLLVNANFSVSFTKRLREFFQTLPLPPICRRHKTSFEVLPWDDTLLTSVLRGQNVTGERHSRGQAKVLHEEVEVVRARVARLQRENKLREVARYLKVVRSTNTPEVEIMRDWVPFYFCKLGAYSFAIEAMFSPLGGSKYPASRLTPAQFKAYLRIFSLCRVPVEMPRPYQPDFDPLLTTAWVAVEGNSPFLKRVEMLKFALRVLHINNAVFQSSESWTDFLELAFFCRTGRPLPEPSKSFQVKTNHAAKDILAELHYTSRLHIPNSFLKDYPYQALAVLSTQALAMRLADSRLTPSLEVILCYKMNTWAVPLLLKSLLDYTGLLQSLMLVLLEELLNPHQPILMVDEHVFIGYFLGLIFTTFGQHVVFETHHALARHLLTSWNEVEHPWQMTLRKQLVFNEAFLMPDKRQLLEHIRNVRH